ncbi:unnamed protein product [Sphenostylis stenocarpa]|uniref:Uncharacterized protein n=1 Tax=Sphenostylis stenocarpa TaxID=92480 RepID=A0AA86VPN6_9FABA|nr:unnamed protein product [Sphenostylis stenocarpa]
MDDFIQWVASRITKGETSITLALRDNATARLRTKQFAPSVERAQFDVKFAR